MAAEDDKTTETPEADAPEKRDASTPDALSVAADGPAEATDEESPAQFGYKRFVYAAYFAAAILVAFVAEKTLTFAWMSLAKWKPNFGEPTDELVMPISALIGVAVALYFWKRTRVRELAEDVASELAKVTWPSRKEVANNTMVVIFTTAFATVFFTLMDRFWSFVTNWVYGT